MTDIAVYMAASSRLRRLIEAEEAILARALARSLPYILNERPDRSPKVHRATCWTVAGRLDRRAAWARSLAWYAPAQVDEVLGDRRGPKAPFPVVMDRDGVEAFPAYRVCGLCKPELDYPTGKQADRPPRPVRARALRELHLGKRLLDVDGSELGHIGSVLISYDVDEGAMVEVTTTSQTLRFDPDTYVDVRSDFDPARPRRVKR